MSDQMQETSASISSSVPPGALWLGLLGVLPFVASAAAVAFLEGPLAQTAMLSLNVYGAVILSFLGGVHWGIAISGAPIGSEHTRLPPALSPALTRTLIYSVVPSIIGWGAVLLPGPASLLCLAVAFAAMLAFDVRRAKSGLVPAWYPKLRWPLSTGAVLSLLVGAAA